MRIQMLSRRNIPLICIAAAYGSLDCVRILVKNGAQLGSTDSVDILVLAEFLLF